MLSGHFLASTQPSFLVLGISPSYNSHPISPLPPSSYFVPVDLSLIPFSSFYLLCHPSPPSRATHRNTLDLYVQLRDFSISSRASVSIFKQNAPPQYTTDISESTNDPDHLPCFLAFPNGESTVISLHNPIRRRSCTAHTEHPHPLFTHIDTYSGLPHYHQITR